MMLECHTQVHTSIPKCSSQVNTVKIDFICQLKHKRTQFMPRGWFFDHDKVKNMNPQSQVVSPTIYVRKADAQFRGQIKKCRVQKV